MSMLSWWHKLRGTSVIPLPPQFVDKSLDEIPFLAIDLELTSLDVAVSKILSIGWVTGQGSCVDLNSSFYKVIRAKGDLEQSPVIHGLIGEDIIKGEHVLSAVEALKPFTTSHVWLFHNTSLDMGVLDKVAERLGIYVPAVVTMDTLRLAVYQLKKMHQVLPPNSATLSVCRDRLDLPAAPAHNALDDALATLTLWFAQQHTIDANGKMMLKDLLHTGALQVVSLGTPPH